MLKNVFGIFFELLESKISFESSYHQEMAVPYRLYRFLTDTNSYLFKDGNFKNEHLVIYSNWPKLKDAGIKTAIFAHDSDSLSFNLKCFPINSSVLIAIIYLLGGILI